MIYYYFTLFLRIVNTFNLGINEEVLARAFIRALNEVGSNSVNDLTDTIPTVIATPIPDGNTRVLNAASYYVDLFKKKLERRGYDLKYSEAGRSLSICKPLRIRDIVLYRTSETFGYHSRDIKNRYFLFCLICMLGLNNDETIQHYLDYIRDNGCPDYFNEATPELESADTLPAVG